MPKMSSEKRQIFEKFKKFKIDFNLGRRHLLLSKILHNIQSFAPMDVYRPC